MKQTGNSLKTALFPQRCFICGDFTASKYGLCNECSTKFNIIYQTTCKRCGLSENFCQCEEYYYHFESVVAAFKNEGAAQRGIYNLKFMGKKDAADFYGEILAQVISKKYRDIKFDLITEIPLSFVSKAGRGYNQAELIAKVIGKKLNIEHKTLLAKRLFTKTQHRLSRESRFANVFCKFKAVKAVKGVKIKGKRVLLCDDIKTTGATLDEAARILRLAGAKEVYCACALITYKF